MIPYHIKVNPFQTKLSEYIKTDLERFIEDPYFKPKEY